MDNPDSVEGRRFSNTLSDLNLEQHVHSPTHTKGHTLDLIITRTSETVVAPIQTHAAVMSDHLPLTFDLRIQKPPLLKVEITSRKLKNINANSFTEDIRQSALVKNSAPGLDDLVDQYYSVFSNILNAHASLITRQVQVRQCPPWFNDTILEAKRDRRRAERKCLAEKTQDNMDALQFVRARVNTLCIQQRKVTTGPRLLKTRVIRRHCTELLMSYSARKSLKHYPFLKILRIFPTKLPKN